MRYEALFPINMNFLGLVLYICATYASQSRVAAVQKLASSSLSALENERNAEDFLASGVKRRGSTYLNLPIFLHSRISILDKEQFSPRHGSGREKIPEATKQVLIPRAPQRATSARNGRSRGINVVCHLKQMIVKVDKQILGQDGFQTELKLGTCDISKTTKNYHLFIYELDQCDSQRKFINNRVTYSNILHYSPVMAPGPIRHAMPFSVPIECHFNRYYYTYKIGFRPEVQHQNFFKPLKTMDSIVLTPRDASWRRLSTAEAYTIGHPMYFQAEGPPLVEGKRLFVDSCYVTVNNSHLSTPQFAVIDNHGCMTASKSHMWSRFIQSGKRNVVRFSLDAFMFNGILGERLYMHCEISVGSVNPTASSKSCTYNQTAERWEELYSSNDVCFCCNSECQASDLSVTSKIITSEPWTMESDFEDPEEEQTTITPFMSMEVETSKVQGPKSHHLPGLAVAEENIKFVEPRKIFDENRLDPAPFLLRVGLHCYVSLSDDE
ncbi:zona pellucida sperm-binding protein 3d.2 isoform X2 [Myxocyprinus asiaticus]|uniref:zona pellucida sperm-binding protein 3d.2 isoform X2 n=1 Tax=Myxocyprinus asiaticus TaxID=70543 RepID=UPI002222515D|nr:zona pellucida sperm-binding protein 3d.2 isoform X2 [Myxocyprinus asiaticus]